MLAPLFHLSQSDVHLFIKLHIPLGDLGNSELLVEDGILYFTAPPYYLRLGLPGDVLETEDHIQFKLDKGDLLVTLTKAEPGQIFKDLDLLSKFIIKPTKTDSLPMKGGIKMLDDSVEKEPEEHKYEWLKCLEKSEEKEEQEQEESSADFCEPEASAPALSAVVPWMCQQKGETDAEVLRPPLTDEHRHRLIVLADHSLPLLPPVTSCSSDELDRTYLYLGLLDLLLAFTHDFCVREGDENSESAWVIVKLASTLSWLEVCSVGMLKQALFSAILSFHTKSWCLYILLEIRRMLVDYPGYYIFADLFLDDYIVWLQTAASVTVLKDLGEHLAAYKMKKEYVDLSLRELEQLSAEIIESEKLASDLGAVT
ncbi:unnamed protein product, partial [Dibothriocephalus latus]